MSQASGDIFIQVSYGLSRETRNSPHYHWDNSIRYGERFVILQQTLEGTGEFIYKRQSHPVPPGHAFLAIPPEPSLYRYPPGAKEPWTFRWINFDGELARRITEGIRARFGPVLPIPAGSPAAFDLDRLFSHGEDQGERDRFEESQMAYQFFTTWWRQLISPAADTAAGIEAAADFLQNHLPVPVRMKEVADHAGLSREHFTRLFRQRFGVPPATHLRQLRLTAAARLLRTTSLPITEIAMRTGFPSLTRFSQIFRRVNKRTPRQYREGQGKRT